MEEMMKKKLSMDFTPEMQIGWRGLGSPQCSKLNTISPSFREGNLREHLGNPRVKNKLLLKRRTLEKTAMLNMGFEGRYLNENVKTRFLPSETAMGMGSLDFCEPLTPGSASDLIKHLLTPFIPSHIMEMKRNLSHYIPNSS